MIQSSTLQTVKCDKEKYYGSISLIVKASGCELERLGVRISYATLNVIIIYIN